MFVKIDMANLSSYVVWWLEILDFFYQVWIFIVDSHFKFFEIEIAIGLIKLMGGEFFYESRRGQGSVFGFVVPGMC